MKQMQQTRKFSPFCLIQEEYVDSPWKLLVYCICLNLTNIKQVRQVIDTFFELYPTPNHCANAVEHDIAQLLKPLGMYNRRAKTLIAMSKAYVAETAIEDLPGVGKYALDSWKIFVQNDYSVVPTDKKLIKYLDWMKNEQK